MTHDVDGLDEVLRRAAGQEALDPSLPPVFHYLHRLRTTPERDPQQVAAGRRAFLDRAAFGGLNTRVTDLSDQT